MKIAVSGTHRTGKSTLVEALASALPDFEAIEEPYRLLEDEGHAFADPPTPVDFELQLARSMEEIEASQGDVILDRSPVDFVAYLACRDDGAGSDTERWIAEVRSAMQTLDLVVFVAIEDPDRIGPSRTEDDDLRVRVDEELGRILLEDPFELGLPVLEVSGSPAERVRQVLTRLGLPPVRS